MTLKNKMATTFQRQTAHKLYIADLIGATPIFNGEKFSALEYQNKRILRVNLLSNIVDKYSNEEKRYCVLTIDDGSGQIRIKGFSDSFTLLNKQEIGDTVYLIGLLRYFNNELYILPEIVRKIDPIWLHIRRLEIKPKEEKKEASFVTIEKIGKIENPKIQILNMIKKEREMDIEKLILSFSIPVEEINSLINDLIQEGEIYESKPGHLCSVTDF